jgi:hypothetical protein
VCALKASANAPDAPLAGCAALYIETSGCKLIELHGGIVSNGKAAATTATLHPEPLFSEELAEDAEQRVAEGATVRAIVKDGRIASYRAIGADGRELPVLLLQMSDAGAPMIEGPLYCLFCIQHSNGTQECWPVQCPIV